MSEYLPPTNPNYATPRETDHAKQLAEREAALDALASEIVSRQNLAMVRATSRDTLDFAAVNVAVDDLTDKIKARDANPLASAAVAKAKGTTEGFGEYGRP